MAKTERAIQMLRLINDHPGTLHYRDLARLLDTSERAIFRYLKTLKSTRIKIKMDRRSGGYRLLNDPLYPDIVVDEVM